MRRTLRPEVPVDLRLTLAPLARGRHDPTIARQGGEVLLATRTADGPATLHAQATGGVVDAEAWGPGAARVLEQLPGLIGLEDPAEEFRPPPGLVDRLRRRFRGLRMCRTGAVWEALLPVILEQKVTGKESKRSYTRLVQRFGEPAPGPGGLRLTPRPEVLAALPYEEFHPFGVERRRTETIRAAARRASRLEEIVWMGRIEAWRRLTAFPGIGVWTAAIVMQVARGDSDAVEVGDYHLPHVVAWNLAGEARADDRRMLDLLEPFSGHRARAARLLELGGAAAPRFGPRLALRSIERI